MKEIKLVTALDLELNQPSNKIIQIGAVVGNIHNGEVIDKISIIVNPNEQLGMCNGGDNSGKTITELTGITQAQVDAGVTLDEAYIQLRQFHKKHKAFLNPVTWGGGDSMAIEEQISKEVLATNSWPFGRRWIDAKTLYVGWRIANGLPVKGGMEASMERLGMKFEGRPHDALDDAFNTFRVFHKMLGKLKDETKLL